MAATGAFPKKSELRWLVVEPTPLKNMLVKMGSSSPNRGENKRYLKPPPSSSLGHGIFVVSLGIGCQFVHPPK